MSSTVTISLPEKTLKKVRAVVATGAFASTSEFFRDLIRHWEESNLLQQIAQNKKEKPTKLLLHGVRASQEEYRTGKAKRLRRAEDLWK